MKTKTIKSSPRKLSLAASTKKIDYEKDFFKWTKKQADLLKKGQLEELDIDNLRQRFV